MRATSVFVSLGLACVASSPSLGATWQMKQRDMQHTGRADYTVPPERLNGTFFDVFLWQKRSPSSPSDGAVDATSMVFFDGAGPGGTDIVAGTYHWPKGIQGMDRHTGRMFWTGNPSGGERIATITPAFSPTGATIYVTNDATADEYYPNGHPAMGFAAATGPASYRHNGDNPTPTHLDLRSPIVGANGRIFLFSYNDRPYGATDDGARLTETWAAATSVSVIYSDPALYQDGSVLKVVIAGRVGLVNAYNGATGAQLWSQNVGQPVDASVTIDPANGRVFVAGGSDDIVVAGLTKNGAALWGTPSKLVYDYIPGTNQPERAQGTGCLSHDGSTYYFQTNGQSANGALYAISTTTGAVKWRLPTHSLGWEMESAAPIVTPNGVIVVGNNDGRTYYAIRDAGTQPMLLDSLVVDAAGNARATATLAPDGTLYLPLRTTWVASNGDGETPSGRIENLFSAVDLTASAMVTLPPPPGQLAVAWNHAVSLAWLPVADPNGYFDHYAVYRATAPFTSVAGLTQIATVPRVDSVAYVDRTALNGTSYYYALTTVTRSGGEHKTVGSHGPRTPHDETDLQVLSLSRTPRFPRYTPTYTDYARSEPSGFGPYTFSAATGLSGGQTDSTQRWPRVSDPVTYTATVRNRGTNVWSGVLGGTWRVDGSLVGTATQSVSLLPGDQTSFSRVVTWDALSHTVQFTLNGGDARTSNDTLAIDTRSVAYLSYMDISAIEDFREVDTPQYPNAATDDYLDWLQRHMKRFNQMFAEAGSPKRVHYDVLGVLRDSDPDPPIDRTPFAIFPFRYYAGQGTLRQSGYYDPAEDLDYGLLHEMGHQLGLIDLYQLNVPSEANQISGLPYNTAPCLMNGVSHFLSAGSATAMTHWEDKAHGYFGQYLYGLPRRIRMRFLSVDSLPLAGATVTVYQFCDRPGLGKVITSQIKAQGLTDVNGVFVLPNVPIDTTLAPPLQTGDTLRANPFGYIAVIGSNGVLHFKIERDGFTDFAWLDVTEPNVAFYQGNRDSATFERRVTIGGVLQLYPPNDMTERNATNWVAWAQGSSSQNTYVLDDTMRVVRGGASLKFVTDGGFDTSVRYPQGFLARWDLTRYDSLSVSVYADNPNIGFQNGSPWIILQSSTGNYYLYQYYVAGSPYDLLNDARGRWQRYTLSVNASPTTNDGWRRTPVGNPVLSQIQALEIHADTWGSGFTLWCDGVGFLPMVTGVEEPGAHMLSLRLPNPYLPGRNISFDVNARTTFDATIYNMKGERIRSLIEDQRASRERHLRWDGLTSNGAPAPAGIYVLCLRASGAELRRKFVLIR
jgi:hypothetical protein